MLGHGSSAKPRGDYSLGAYAAGARDLLLALGHESATVVGHSLGGGVAMQFAYQFPTHTDRLGLVASGGLGEDVNVFLRAATLPGAELVLPLITKAWVTGAGRRLGDLLGAVGLKPGADITEIARGYASLADGEARAAFLSTARSVIDHRGQRVSARDRLYLAEAVPTMIVWGERDRIIPVAHGHWAAEAMPGSRFTVFDDAGHFPHLDRPLPFARALARFVKQTKPARLGTDEIRKLLDERALAVTPAMLRIASAPAAYARGGDLRVHRGSMVSVCARSSEPSANGRPSPIPSIAQPRAHGRRFRPPRQLAD